MIRSVAGTSAASVEQRRLAGRCGPTDQQVAAGGDDFLQQRDDFARRECRERKGAHGEPSNRQAWPIDGDRLDHRAHSDPSGRRASTVGLVRSIRRPMGRRMCSIAVVTAALLIVPTRTRAPARRSTRRRAVDDDFVYRRVVEPSLQPAQRRPLGDHVDHAAPQRDDQRLRQAGDQQSGVDGAGDGGVEPYFGRHRYTERVLDVARGQRPTRLVDQHDACRADREMLGGGWR
jgi:hypothetical protein